MAQQSYEDVEPQWFRGRISEASLGVYAEGEEERVSSQSGVSSTYQRLFEGPLIGLGMDGSIYHPNLLQYNLHSDGAVGWTQEKTTTSTGTVNFSEFDYLGNFNGNAILLANKPYSTTLFVSNGHTYQEYDFFNRVLVDTMTYGAQTGYREGPVPVNVSVTHLQEDTSGLGFDTTLEQTTVSLQAHNDRPSGRTTFTYSLDDFDRSIEAIHASGTQQSFGMADTETFGDRKNIEWRNNLDYTLRQFTDAPGDVITAGSHLSIQHSDSLWSMYDADYLRDNDDSAVTENYDASAAVRHQLYSSLTSGLRFQVIHYTSEGQGADFESTQYNPTWTETYTKRLSDSTRLTIGGSLGYSHTDQQSSSGTQIVGEAHTFGAGGAFLNSFFLNLPNVNSATIEVFNQGRTIRYTRDVDYSVTVIGARTLLQLLQLSPAGLTASTPVVVDYQAAPQGSGSVDGEFADGQIRLDFFNGMWGIYSRYDSANYSAPAGIVVQNVSDLAFGTDFYWKWLRAGAEYDIYDSTFASYNSARLFQTLTFTLDDASTLSLSLSEGWTDYRTSSMTEEFYSAITRYHRAVTSHFGLDLEAGVTEQTGSIVDEFLAAFRPGITYSIGKLAIKAGYDLEYQDTQNSQQRMMQTFFLRAQRSF